MLNRTKQPTIHPIKNLQLPRPNRYVLQNGIEVYEINMGTQDVVKVEIIFNAGRPYEKKKLAGRATARMLREGTKKHSSAAIAETVDYYGGTLASPVNLDTANVILYSLNKHLERLLPLVAEIVSEPIFPQVELDTVITNSLQQIKLNREKGDVVAYREITEQIFTPEHPYGYNSTEEDYKSLERTDLFAHFKEQYHAGNCTIILSGKIRPNTIALLDKYLGTVIPKGIAKTPVFPSIQTAPRAIKKELKDNSQSAIRIGCRMFNKQHPDYNGFFVLNTILGGYFGSRLMMNIREEKGYTYNIFSGLDSMVYDGYFTIGTEVGTDYVEGTLSEIYKEMDTLKTDLVNASELEMVRNYLLGNMLTMLDGPMNVADIIKTMVVEKLDFDTFSSLENTINTITAADLRELANRYFVKEKMWEIVVGE